MTQPQTRGETSFFEIRASSFCPLTALTSGIVFDWIERVKWLALFALLALESSCTTLANRRDLYSPQPDPDLHWHRQGAVVSHAEEVATSLVDR